MDNDLANELSLIRDSIDSDKDLANLKQELKPLVVQLKDFKSLKANIEMEYEEKLKAVNKQITEHESKIRSIWEPLVQTDKAEMDLDGIKIVLERTINIATEDKPAAIDWLEANGFQDVMKWDIHHATLKALAKEKFSEGVEIAGLKYTPFQLIKVK